jgi:hypothetical protein
MTAIDTGTNVSSYLQTLRARGVTAVGRYYSSGTGKRLTKAEAAEIGRAGMQIFVVFENDGDPTLTSDTGVHHGQIALDQARVVGQPEGSAIYFALEHLPDGYTKKHLRGIRDYINGVRSVLDGKYLVGAYSDGVVCDSLLSQKLCDVTWLSASKFEGSEAFYASRRWSLAQDSHINQNWNGLSVDLNEVNGDFGVFTPTGVVAAAGAAARPRPAIAGAMADDVEATGFAGRAASTAIGEWNFFGNQTYDVNGRSTHAGHTEGEPGFAERIGTYWVEGTNTHGLDGTDDVPWSAAFISYVMKTAGAGNRFRYSTQHSIYIAQGIRDFQRKRDDAGYWTRRLNEATPEVGDLICWARQAGIDYDHQNGGNYKGHCDFVVAVGAGEVSVIGGNVGNSVTRRPVPCDADGFLKPVVVNGETLFGLMKNRIA